MSYLPPLALLVLWPFFLPADELLPLPFRTDISGEVYYPTRVADPQVVENSTILDPTGELLPPFLATRLLGEKDYMEWCLRWNRRQYSLASRRAIPPREINGSVSTDSGFSQSWSGGGSWSQFYESTTQSRQQVWQVGGYGGGPVTIYNPFVLPQAVKR